MMVEKSISELMVGDYVVEIVAQKGSFTLNKPGHVKNQKVIQYFINKGVISLRIDTSKRLQHHTDKVKEKVIIATIAEQPVAAEQNITKDVVKTLPSPPLIAKISQARILFKNAKNIQRDVFYNAEVGRPIDLAPIKDITEKTIEAIFVNPDALACVINIRMKNEYLLEHSVSVSILMAIFAHFLKIDKQIIHQLTIGAFLHDVGKIMIPNKIINKPSKLTEYEYSIMKTHVNHSIDIISKTAGMSKLSLEVATLHHEKLDGFGYPYQVQADDISQYGRMIAICDIFDALTTDRVYKEGYSYIKAFNILMKLAQENHLELILVNQFIKCMGVYPVGSLVELNSHKLAIVESRNHQSPISPKVRSFYHIDHGHYVMTEDIDLSNNDDFIIKGVRAAEFKLDMNKIVEFLLMQG